MTYSLMVYLFVCLLLVIGKIPDLTKVENKHSVSGLLEKYFRELPQPVTTWAMYEDFMKAAGMCLILLRSLSLSRPRIFFIRLYSTLPLSIFL